MLGRRPGQCCSCSGWQQRGTGPTGGTVRRSEQATVKGWRRAALEVAQRLAVLEGLGDGAGALRPHLLVVVQAAAGRRDPWQEARHRERASGRARDLSGAPYKSRSSDGHALRAAAMARAPAAARSLSLRLREGGVGKHGRGARPPVTGLVEPHARGGSGGPYHRSVRAGREGSASATARAPSSSMALSMRLVARGTRRGANASHNASERGQGRTTAPMRSASGRTPGTAAGRRACRGRLA